MSTPSTVNQAQSPVVVGFANSITETLEGTSWWTNNEGGLATKDTFITGIRLYGDQEGIDYVREGLVVTRLASLESNTAETFRSRVKMARATALQRRPVGVVMRHDHPDLEEMGIDMEGEEFAILGQFLITDFWMMWKGNVKFIMVKLEKFDPLSPSKGNAISVPSQGDCGTCKEALVARYKNLPAGCGYYRCSTTNTKSEHNSQPADGYDEVYLATREDLTQVPKSSLQLLPDPPRQLSKEDIAAQFEASETRSDRINWEGWFCERCKRFNQRVFWNRFECRKCGYIFPYGMPDYSFEELSSEKWRGLTEGSSVPGLWYAEHIKPFILDAEHSHPGYVTHKFELDGDNEVWLLLPKDFLIDLPGGSKDRFGKLWAGMQDGTIPVKRCPANAGKVPGQLTKFMAHNYGEPYNAKMETETTPLDDAPAVIRDVKDEMVSVISEIVGEVPVFNEMLAIANYPNMSMGWHKDGENGVGFIVASTSYGGQAIMSFAMDKAHMVGKVRKVYLYDTILPGCLEEEKKRDLLKKKEDGVYDEEEYREKFRELVDNIEPPKDKETILKIPLPGTGAIMIQRGASLNKRFVHMVENDGIARMVFTCRSIEHDEHQRPAKRAKTSED
ncbi:hypothetical protein PG984_013313 [Apiospora sp. TS-2023a]